MESICLVPEDPSRNPLLWGQKAISPKFSSAALSSLIGSDTTTREALSYFLAAWAAIDQWQPEIGFTLSHTHMPSDQGKLRDHNQTASFQIIVSGITSVLAFTVWVFFGFPYGNSLPCFQSFTPSPISIDPAYPHISRRTVMQLFLPGSENMGILIIINDKGILLIPDAAHPCRVLVHSDPLPPS